MTLAAVLQVAAEQLLGLSEDDARTLVEQAETATRPARSTRNQARVCPDLTPETPSSSFAHGNTVAHDTGADCIDTTGETITEGIDP